MSFLEEIIFFFYCFFGRITCWSKIGCNNEKNIFNRIVYFRSYSPHHGRDQVLQEMWSSLAETHINLYTKTTIFDNKELLLKTVWYIFSPTSRVFKSQLFVCDIYYHSKTVCTCFNSTCEICRF